MASETRIKAKDVAKALGISETTVSRALSGKGRVKPDTVEMVRNYMRGHGGLPVDDFRTKNIALILPEEYSAKYPTFFFECLAGVQKACNQRGYDVIVVSVSKDSTATLNRLVKVKRIDGAILTRTYENDATLAYLKENGVRIVTTGFTEVEGVVCIDQDNQKSSREMTQVIIDKGCKRLLMFDGKSEHIVNNYRRLGFQEACEDERNHLEYHEIIENIDNPRTVQVAVRRALREKVDGIICADDYISMLTMNELKRRNIDSPVDIMVASLFDNAYLELHAPSVTSVRFDNYAIGEEAARELIREIEDPDSAKVKLKILSYQIMMRETTL